MLWELGSGGWGGGEDAHGYLVGVVLVDYTDVLAVWEPEKAEVFGFLQVTVQVVKNLRKEWRLCWSQDDGGDAGSQHHPSKENIPNGPNITKERGMCLIRYWTLSGNESTTNAGDARETVSIPGLGRSPREGNGNLLQYSRLENPMDRGAWWATIHGTTKSWT